MSQKAALNEDGYDERFMRMWQYYLNYCEGGFLERVISTVQLVVAKPQHRDYMNRV
jgi:cyclopropane-fatty-acyl-phospholipid synthase